MTIEGVKMEYEKLAVEFAESIPKVAKMPEQVDTGRLARGEMVALHYLARQSGTAAPSELGIAMNISSARVAKLLGTLCAKGFISRRSDKKDRRRIMVCLTKKGREYEETCRTKMLAKIRTMLEALGEEDAVTFVRIIKKMARLTDTGTENFTSGKE